MTVRFYDDDVDEQQFSVSFKYSIVKIECNCRQTPRFDENTRKLNKNTLESNDVNQKLCEAEKAISDMKKEPEAIDPPTYWLYSTFKECLIILNKVAHFLNQVNLD